MTSPEIKFLISVAAVAIIYAFVCQTRLAGRARVLAAWLEKERPAEWASLNPIARNWNGGFPALKYLYRRGSLDLPEFDKRYRPLRDLERRSLWAMLVAGACFGLLFVGLRYLGWHW